MNSDANNLNPPAKFIVDNPFKHHNPEYIREIAKSYGFERVQEAGRFGKKPHRQSEIWMLPAEVGWWFIRMDDQGHPPFHFGSRPHYHKEWIATQAQVNKYLNGPGGRPYAYQDDGSLIGRMEEITDLQAKQSHIPR